MAPPASTHIYLFLLRKATTSALSAGFLKPTKAMFVPGCQIDAGGSARVRAWAGSEAATGRDNACAAALTWRSTLNHRLGIC